MEKPELIITSLVLNSKALVVKKILRKIKVSYGDKVNYA